MSLLNGGGGRSPLKFDPHKGKNSPIFKKFKGFVRRYGLLDQVESVLVALSGGPDSVCLLNLLFLLSKKRGFRLYAAHFHHGLRGVEADRDALFSKKICEENCIPFFLGKGDVKVLSKKNGLGIQDAARRLRYDFLKDLAREKQIDAIATGHTADDQAEELIIRFIRGASLQGLSGIRARRDEGIIRPVLFATKKELVEHLELMGISFVTDSSNLEDKYTRNRVRQLLIPVIRKHFNPSISKCLSRTAMLLQEDEDALMALARKAYERARLGLKDVEGPKIPENMVALRVKMLADEPNSVLGRALLMALKDAGVPVERIVSDHIVKVQHLLRGKNPSSFYRLPSGFLAVRIYNRLLISTDFLKELKAQCILGPCPQIDGQAKIDLGPCLGVIRVKETDYSAMKLAVSGETSSPRYPRPIYLGYEDGLLPLHVRLRIPGDRFIPLGFDKPLKLKDFFIGRHVPKILRDFVPLLVKDSEIAGVCGIEVAHPFRVRGKCALKVHWEPKGLLKTLFLLLKEAREDFYHS